MTLAELKNLIRTVPDWPQPGVQFRDICPLLYNPEAFDSLINHLADLIKEMPCDGLAGVDARGFILGGAVARQLRLPFIPVRKKGKLPGATISQAYTLEYGQTEVEIQTDACKPGDRIVVLDDLIATGGTLVAAADLFERIGGKVTGVVAVIDLPVLGGSQLLKDKGRDPQSLFTF
jgi:adenine phosphoribosyltransferase